MMTRPCPSRITEKNWKEASKCWVQKYKRKASVKKPINVKFKNISSNARSKFKTGEPEAELILSSKNFPQFFKLDRESAETHLKFAIAHEIAHVKQREEKGLGYLRVTPLIEIEAEAYRMGSKISGISTIQNRRAERKLTDKMYGE